MKNVFGKILLFVLLSVCHVVAEEPTSNDLNIHYTESGCSYGFIPVVYTKYDWPFIAAVVASANGNYYAKILLDSSTGGTSSGNMVITWKEDEQRFRMNSTYYSNFPDVTQCSTDNPDYQNFIDAIHNLDPNEVLQGVDYLNETYTNPYVCRYDMTADDDGDGMLDYYDLDCERYNEYLQYCQENGIEPLDLVDYQYFQNNSIEDWLQQRNNMTDTDGDGFSDGYETIHGTSMYDGSDYPLGIPDTGSSYLVVGGIDEKEPWRLEEYNDSGYSRGYVYDHGYDPFGTEELTFEDDPDWGAMDSDNDGLTNNEEVANGTNPYIFGFHPGFSYIYHEDGGYWVTTGYTEDGALGDYGTAPTDDEWLESHEDYETGDYAYNPSEYTFGNEKYDGLLDKTSKIKFNCDNVRPQTQRDYKLHFNISIPGEGAQSFAVSVMPDTSTPAGAVMEIVRQLVRGMAGVIFSYVFVKHVWLAIR